MCGSAPVATTILYSKLKGATMARLIDYTDSGTISGNLDRVVSYASFVIE
jgi:AmmeMemoRadiSam system protein B